jgi:hypothetical protein
MPLRVLQPACPMSPRRGATHSKRTEAVILERPLARLRDAVVAQSS